MPAVATSRVRWHMARLNRAALLGLVASCTSHSTPSNNDVDAAVAVDASGSGTDAAVAIACDPLADNDFLGSNVGSKTGTACGSSLAVGCYGAFADTSQAGPEFTCSLPFGGYTGSNATGNLVEGSPIPAGARFFNSCAPGYMMSVTVRRAGLHAGRLSSRSARRRIRSAHSAVRTSGRSRWVPMVAARAASRTIATRPTRAARSAPPRRPTDATASTACSAGSSRSTRRVSMLHLSISTATPSASASITRSSSTTRTATATSPRRTRPGRRARRSRSPRPAATIRCSPASSAASITCTATPTAAPSQTSPAAHVLIQRPHFLSAR